MPRHGIRYMLLLLGPFLLGSFLLMAAASAQESLTPGEQAARIAAARARIADLGLSWTAGRTSMSHLSREQISALLALDPDLMESAPAGAAASVPREAAGYRLSQPGSAGGEFPCAWDWRDLDGVTPVRDQGLCGDCWNFAATAAFESYALIYDGIAHDFSEQNVLDCNPYGYGCSGGWMTAAYKHFMRQGALAESCVPYLADDSGSCDDRGCDPLDYLVGWRDVIPTVPELKRALLEGPLAVAMTVHEDFLLYTGGCYEHEGAGSPNHAVLLVGWDDTLAGGAGGWIAKNSWGPEWGAAGYFAIRFHQCEFGFGATQVEYRPRHNIVIEHTPLEPRPAGSQEILFLARIESMSGLLDPASLMLHVSIAGEPFASHPLQPGGAPDQYACVLPEPEPGSELRYYFEAGDLAGRRQSAPARAPALTYGFRTGYHTLHASDFEANDPAEAWTHHSVTPGFGDQWHRSGLRNHTPEGGISWRLGPPEDADYADLLDAALVSPEVMLSPDCELRFWHWIEAEHSPFLIGRAYDGGFVEISQDAGSTWERIDPLGGYPYLARQGMIPGPFESGQPLFSGGRPWREAVFRIADREGPARFRFRFGSDGAITFGGWHVDDVRVWDFSGQGPSTGVQIPDPASPAPLPYESASLRPALLPCAPNPVPEQTTLRFRLPAVPAGEAVALSIYDCQGRLRAQPLRSSRLAPGHYAVTWNGCNEEGARLEAGAYFLRLQAGVYVSESRLLLLPR